jgi:hypothetical protein
VEQCAGHAFTFLTFLIVKGRAVTHMLPPLSMLAHISCADISIGIGPLVYALGGTHNHINYRPNIHQSPLDDLKRQYQRKMVKCANISFGLVFYVRAKSRVHKLGPIFINQLLEK